MQLLLILNDTSKSDALIIPDLDLNETKLEKFAEIAARINVLLAPLTFVSSHDDLMQRIEEISESYINLNSHLSRMLEKHFKQLSPSIPRLYQLLINDINNNSYRFSDEDLSKLIGAIKSYQGFDQLAIKNMLGDTPEAHAAYARLAGRDLRILINGNYASMCLQAIMSILKNWDSTHSKVALPALCDAIDDFMNSVEDFFLGLPRSAAIGRIVLLEESTETIPFDSVRHESTFKVEFRGDRALRDLEGILHSCPPSEMRQFTIAMERLQTNPYPNPEAGKTIRVIVSSSPVKLRIWTGYRYKMTYIIEGDRVIIDQIKSRENIIY